VGGAGIVGSSIICSSCIACSHCGYSHQEKITILLRMLLIWAVAVASVLMLQFSDLNANPQASPSSDCSDILKPETCNTFVNRGICLEHGHIGCRKTCNFCTPPQGEDPAWCSGINAATQCIHKAISDECTILCTDKDDPDFCAFLDVASQCGFDAIASECRILCSASTTTTTTTTAPPTTTTTTTLTTTPTTTSTIPLTGPNMYNASWYGNTDFVKRALSAGVNPDWIRRNETNLPEHGWQETSLFPAAGNNHTQIVRALLEAGADANHSLGHRHGETAIYSASAKGNTQVVQLLIDAGARLNDVIANCGAGPLHSAAAKGHVMTAVLLIKNGANPNKDSCIGTPYTAAISAGHDELANIIASYN
ncbi:unnamed protein product, partial [Meganyctiphanes norvegica]